MGYNIHYHYLGKNCIIINNDLLKKYTTSSQSLVFKKSIGRPQAVKVSLGSSLTTVYSIILNRNSSSNVNLDWIQITGMVHSDTNIVTIYYINNYSSDLTCNVSLNILYK